MRCSSYVEAEPIGRRARSRTEVVVVGLCEIQEASVVPEILRQQLRMSVEPQAADHERVEVPGEEVREIEGGRLLVVHRLPRVVPGEEAVAMSSRKPLDAVSVEHLVERATRTAVGVCDEDSLVAPCELVQLRVDCRRDQLGS